MTHESARRDMLGHHVHTFANPSGVVFTFGCFAHAECAESGASTAQDTWFPRCRWRYAHCRACAAHLGWRFDGAEAFWALILDRLA